MRPPHLIIVLVIIIITMAMIIGTLQYARRGGVTKAISIGLVKVPSNAPRIIVKSVFNNGSQIPINYTCNGLDVSIPLYISNVPNNTKSLMVIMEDLDAPNGIFVHWVLYDVPPNVTEIPQGVSAQYYVPGVGYQGLNDFGKVGYGGPCPPAGPPHEYVIIVLAE
ncbi:YbhB/YbcL family Raf kinase inhibitor-like protein [Vulcanisaeta souniana]|uniref:YbhB/YbcL family Raf kinase inhibitor-like protein n=1 Tax=Vulcanisaeta souniana TaxID=164452 RepID=UPI000B017C0A|nr:YbhB/YbcL family Raf kinase inhibitor-like protein [Vulcanisaeta souniana]